MGDKSSIEWTDATWNPITGCAKISPGCDNCYAARFAERWRGIKGHPYEQGFDLKVHDNRFSQPERWRKPRRIFVNSMSDLFHAGVVELDVMHLLTLMKEVDRHTYQILTKRPSRMRKMVGMWANNYGEVPNHMWMGVSVENQKTVEARIPDLLQTPAKLRFLSVEPLLENIGLSKYLGTGQIHWVIVGGESGPKARRMNPDWAMNVRDTCQQYGVPFFFKQHGGPRPKTNGRLLEGRTWDEMPDQDKPGRLSETK